jgi:hypothetical protein
MNKSALKKFAQFARTKLIADMKQQISYWQKAKEISGWLQTIDGKIVNGEHIRAKQSMTNELVKKSVDELAEQAGYTWFNRIMAIKFMEHHNYLPTTASWFSNDDGSEYPEIVHDAVHQAKLIGMDTSKVDTLYQTHRYEEVYRELFIGLCNSLHDTLWFLFERIDDWSMLLFPQQLMWPSHIIKHEKQWLLTIPDEDRQEVEVIWWMYQYYISERKEELDKSKEKLGKWDIASATQLFTPEWIVKYIVHNTIWKLSERELSHKIKTERWFDYDVSDITKLKVLDPAVWSWHLLVRAYDVLKDVYLDQWYSPSTIPTLILQNNLYGFDICPRAHQLACFALMMKWKADDESIESKVELLNNIIVINEVQTFENVDEKRYPHLRKFLRIRYNASLYGSLIRIPEDLEMNKIIKEYELIESEQNLFVPCERSIFEKLLLQTELLSERYDCVIANPPYKAWWKVNDSYKKFLNSSYPEEKADLFAVFISRCLELCHQDWFVWMVTMHSWMFLSSYESMRKTLIETKTFDSLVHHWPHWFPEIWWEVVQTVSFIIINSNNSKFWLEGEGTYINLCDYWSASIKDNMLQRSIKNDNNSNLLLLRNQWDFESLPWNIIAYKLSNRFIWSIINSTPLSKFADIKQWMSTANNDLFTRSWFEISKIKINQKRKWYNKWAWFLKWTEWIDTVINWLNNWEEIKNYDWSAIRNEAFFFREWISWSAISKEKISMRLIDNKNILWWWSNTIFIKDNDEVSLYYLLWLFNSKVSSYYVSAVNPTTNISWWVISNFPILNHKVNLSHISKAIEIVTDSNNFSEISRLFSKNHLLSNKQTTLEKSYQEFCNVRTEKFFELHANEEGLNREFIKIYWLEDELTPDVPLAEITILQDELDSRKLKQQENQIKESKELPWKREVIVKQLMSYMLWCMMGRYSIDTPGLVYAGGDFDSSQYTVFPADKDGILPVLDDEYFPDDIVARTKLFVKTVWWEQSFTQNRSRLAQALWWSRSQSADETIREYWRKSFSDDHFQKYKSRPIYWYFSSHEKKWKWVFQAIVYLHRYDKDTISRIRNNYLDKFQRKIHEMIQSQESRKMQEHDIKKLAEIEKELKNLYEMQAELAQYDECLKHVAEERIELDLDDGVKENYSLMMEKWLVVKYKL